MEMVLERAAKLEAQATGNSSEDSKIQDGMRLGARFMREDDFNLRENLDKPKGERALLVKGALTVFMRNIQLPRDEDDISVIEKAMRGVLQLAESNDLVSRLGEAKTITEQYEQHKKQIHSQLEEQFTQQIAMAQQQGQGGVAGLAPENHPKFAEEWQKITVQLQEQYGESLQKHKVFIERTIANF